MMSSPAEYDVPEYLRVQVDRMCQNLARVEHLIALHKFLDDSLREIRHPPLDDILRSAVVLLHASLEDFLRSVALKHLPRTDNQILKQIPLSGNPHLTKYTLGDLIPYRGMPVDAILDEAIDSWIHQRSFNHCRDISTLLEQIGIPVAYCSGCFPELDAMIQRRHCIAHNADRPRLSSNADSGEATPIDRDSVTRWHGAVRQLMQNVLFKLQFVVESPSKCEEDEVTECGEGEVHNGE